MHKMLQQKKRGSALPLSVLAVLLLLAMGMGLLSLGLNVRVLSIRNASDISARCAADAGLTKALYELNQMLKSQSLNDDNLPESVNETLPGLESVFSYTVTNDPGNGYTILSTGVCGSNARTVQATLRLQGPFDYAIAVRENLVLKPNSFIDGYNFSGVGEKLQVATTSKLPMQIILGKGSIVDGDVAVGVGGDPEAVICAPEASITGQKFALTNEIDFPPVTVPQWVENLPSQGIISSPGTIAYSAKYSGINLGQGNIMMIDGPVTLYVTGDIGLMNSAQIQINENNPNASLTLYLDGNVYCKNGGIINNLTEDPTKLKIYGLDNCVNLSFASSGTFYGGIYAPNAMLNLKTSVELFGSFVTKQFLQALAANVHYDASLNNAVASDPCSGFTIKRWRE
jgi:hypothetical protein